MKLMRLKEWVTLEEAARHLSQVFDETFSDVDVLRLGIDGYLPISLFFVNNVPVRKIKIVSQIARQMTEETGSPVSEGEVIRMIDAGLIDKSAEDQYTIIQRRCYDLWPHCAGWDEIIGLYHSGRDGPKVKINQDCDPKFVVIPPSDDAAYILMEAGPGWDAAEGPPQSEDLRPAQTLPLDDAGICIRTNAIQEFIAAQADPAPPQSEEHISPALSLVNQAAREFWKTADPDDSSTHPTNSEVIDWLESQGMSQSQAAAAARIIRPEWATQGRRKG